MNVLYRETIEHNRTLYVRYQFDKSKNSSLPKFGVYNKFIKTNVTNSVTETSAILNINTIVETIKSSSGSGSSGSVNSGTTTVSIGNVTSDTITVNISIDVASVGTATFIVTLYSRGNITIVGNEHASVLDYTKMFFIVSGYINYDPNKQNKKKRYKIRNYIKNSAVTIDPIVNYISNINEEVTAVSVTDTTSVIDASTSVSVN
jgi:hypothetical protein